MEFKKINDSSFQVKHKNTKAKIMVSLEENQYFTIKLVEDDEVTSLDRPGEYGLKNTHFILLEENVENFKGKPTIVNMSDMMNMNVIIFGSHVDPAKQTIDKMPNPSIIVAPLMNDPKLKSFIKKVQPYYVVFIEGFAGQTIEEKSLGSLQGEINFVPNESGVVKFDEKDFEQEEDVITQAYILK